MTESKPIQNAPLPLRQPDLKTRNLFFNNDKAIFCELDGKLRELSEKGIIRAIDRHFACFLVAESGGSDWHPDDMMLLVMLAALASKQLSRQHTCLELSAIGQPFVPVFTFPQLQSLLTTLARLDIVKTDNQAQLNDIQHQVLVENNRFYIYRYWCYEQQVFDFLTRRTAEKKLADSQKLQHCMQPLLKENRFSGETDWQMVAVLSACIHSLSIITGGPGTGKTTTVAKLIVALSQLSEKVLDIKLVAPTGKAAARLGESLQKAQQFLSEEGAGQQQQTKIQCSTIHRMLGSLPGSHLFRHNREYPIIADVLIIDEASMIDLPLLSKLVQAVPDTCRVVFLGDANQLASVEVGSVFSDMCLIKDLYPQNSEDFRQLAAAVLQEPLPKAISSPSTNQIPAFRDHIVALTKSHRFSAESGIGQLASAVNTGATKEVLDLLKNSDAADDIEWSGIVDFNQIWQLCASHIRAYFAVIEQHDYRNAFLQLRKMQILCLTRKGPYGVKGINVKVEDLLLAEGLKSGDDIYYAGRPLMITANDHDHGLFNGDIGICGENKQGTRVVYFEQEGQLKAYLPAQLPAHETMYAMTIHKSQGSEFDAVTLVLPESSGKTSELLTRELLYTGITRAKKHIAVLCSRKTITQAVQQRCLRASGLAARLVQ